MTYIAPSAMIAVVFLDILVFQWTGAIAQSSVGGTLALALAFLAAALAVGIHEAWSRRRSLLGWIVSIIVSVVGAFVATSLSGIVLEPIFKLLKLNGSLPAIGHPLHFIASGGMMLHTLLGSWIALSIAQRRRSEA